MDLKYNESPTSKKVSVTELTPQQIVALVNCELLRMMADMYGSAWTINEVRVMNTVHIHWLLHGRPCTMTWVSEQTEMPKSTVSRAIGKLIDTGHVREQVDHDDRRVRLIMLTEKAQQNIDTVCTNLPIVAQILNLPPELTTCSSEFTETRAHGRRPLNSK